MDQQNQIQTWLETAVGGIRFKPDRVEAERELRGHIEDKMADLRRLYPDLLRDEAEKMALDRMGDPEEIGKELANIHKPWLGWLWRASQAVLGLAAVVLLIAGVQTLTAGDNGWFSRADGLIQESGAGTQALWLEPPAETVEVDGYRISVVKVVRTQWNGDQRLGIQLRSLSPFFWAKTGGTLCDRISAVDSQGNYYPSTYERWEVLRSEKAGSWSYVSGSRGGSGPVYQDYTLWIRDLDPEARWVRFEYDWLGRIFSLTVELEEAGT